MRRHVQAVFVSLAAIVIMASQSSAGCTSCESCARSCAGSSATLFQYCSNSGAGCDSGAPDTIEADRPDFTEALSAVGRGRVQLETGYTYGSDDDGPIRVRSQSYPQALFRIGMFADWFEFRIATNYLDETTRNGTARSNRRGSEDLYIGAKIALVAQDGARPAMALIPQMVVPTARQAFTDDEVLPGLNWIYGWDLTENWSFGGSTQANRAIDETGEAYTEFAQSLVTGLALTDWLGMYGEWFMFTPHSATASVETEHYFDGGFTFLVTDNLQLDILAGWGLNDPAQDFFGGGGLSVRF